MKKSRIIFLLIISSVIILYNFFGTKRENEFVEMCSKELIGYDKKDLSSFLSKYNKTLDNKNVLTNDGTESFIFMLKTFVINNTMFCEIVIDDASNKIIDVNLSEYQEIPDDKK